MYEGYNARDEDPGGDGVVGQLYLDRVEAAGMARLTQALLDADIAQAWDVARLLRYLSIV